MIWQKRSSPGSELQLLVPKPAREQLFLAYHASLFGGHLGRNQTLARLSHRFYWSGMSNDVKDWLGQCTVCWGGSRGGGSRGPRTPPGPQRGGPGPLFQNEENSIFYLFYLLSCYNASEQLSGHQISKFSWGLSTAPPKPPAAYGIFHSSIDSFMTCRNINSLCLLDKITVLFSISISSKIYLKNSD